MATIDFPSNPTLGQIFTSGNKSWQWNGTGWASIVGNVTTDGSQQLANKQLVNPETADQVLFDAASIAWDASKGSIASVTLAASGHVIATPTNLKKGIYVLHVVQDTTGGRTYSFDSGYHVETYTAATLPNQRDTFMFVSDGTSLFGKLFATTDNAPSVSATMVNATAALTELMDTFKANGNVIAAAATISTMFGVNLSGMEASQASVRYGSSTYPNRNYTVPRKEDLQYLHDTGVSKVRLPILWEILQPILASSPANSTVVSAHNIWWNGVQNVKGGFDQYYQSYIQQVLDNAHAAGITVILDVHNYCRYRDFIYQGDGSVNGLTSSSDKHYLPWTSDNTQVQTRIFSKAVTPSLTQADYNDLWTRIATLWKGHPALEGFGLMNEPNSMPTSTSVTAYNDPYVSGNVEDLTIWPTYAQAAINAIRATGSTDKIYVGGNVWQTPVSWASNNPSFPLTDSANNIVYEAHVYCDAASGGFRFDYDYEVGLGTSTGESGPINAQTLVNRLTPWVNWLTANAGGKGAVTETGMPLQLKGGVLDQRWVTEFQNGVTYLNTNNIPTFIWMGGNHWSNMPYPINHTPQWYQNKTLEPQTGSVMKYVASISHAVLFDEGSTYSASGAPVSIKVQARGNITAPITVNIACDAGTLSAASVTLGVGFDSEATFTFTPPTNGKGTVTYAIPGGAQVPPPRTVYAYSDPVTLANTNLADAAKTLIGKYKCAFWNMADAYTDYLNGAACAQGSTVRAVSDSGNMSSLLNPMHMLNWYNTQGGNMGGDLSVLPTWGKDPSGNPYMDVSAAGSHGLWCKKILPGSDANSFYSPNPTNVVPFGLHQSHFCLAAINLQSQGTGVVFEAVQNEQSYRASLTVASGVPQLQIEDANGQTQTIAGPAALATNSPVVLSYSVVPGTQLLRQNGAQLGSSAVTFATTPFNAMHIGSGYESYYETAAAPVKVYGVLVGQGNITASELWVLEKYMATLNGATIGAAPAAPAPAPSPGAPAPAPVSDSSVASEDFGSAGLGFELTADDHTTLIDSGAPASSPGSGIQTWMDKSGRANNLTQPDTNRNPIWNQDASDANRDYLLFFANADFASGGGSTSGFFFTAAIMSGDGGGNGLDRVLYSDCASANVGHKVRITWDNYVEYSVGNGTNRTIVKSSTPVTNMGKNLITVWHDPSNSTINAQVDNASVASTSYSGLVSAGATGARIAGDYGVTDQNVWSGRIYAMLMTKNSALDAVKRMDSMNWCGSKGGISGFSAGGSAPAPAPGPAPAPTPAPVTPSANSGTGFPLGSMKDGAYPYGVMPSSSVLGANADNITWLQTLYNNYKAARIVPCPGVAGGLADQFGDTTYLCVSEGMGYAMLLAVIFNDQATFDGLLTTARAKYAYSWVQYGGANANLGYKLMNWKLYADGSDAGGGWAAPDGELDMAMAMLMADRQWGTTGTTWNYRSEAFGTINALKTFLIRADGTLMGSKDPGESRTSDYMFGHFRAFTKATGDPFWEQTVLPRCYDLLHLIQTQYSPNAGLVCDWIAGTNTPTPYPSPGGPNGGDVGANAHEDSYWWNSHRDPWRLGTDYLFSGDWRAKEVIQKISNFFNNMVNSAGGDVTAIHIGWSLAGVEISGGNDAAFMAPIMLGMMCDATYQSNIDKLFTWNKNHITTGYYDGDIQLLDLVVACGIWWYP